MTSKLTFLEECVGVFDTEVKLNSALHSLLVSQVPDCYSVTCRHDSYDK